MVWRGHAWSYQSWYSCAYFEDARVRHAHDIGLFPYDSDKFPFIVASMTFNFFKQIKHPKNLTVGLKISRIGGKSFDYEYGLFMENDDECAISCSMTMVCFDFSDQKSVQVFDEIKKEFQGELKWMYLLRMMLKL